MTHAPISLSTHATREHGEGDDEHDERREDTRIARAGVPL
jgi:hypothetical protein